MTKEPKDQFVSLRLTKPILDGLRKREADLGVTVAESIRRACAALLKEESGK
jgi:hypothetical protein